MAQELDIFPLLCTCTDLVQVSLMALGPGDLLDQ